MDPITTNVINQRNTRKSDCFEISVESPTSRIEHLDYRLNAMSLPEPAGRLSALPSTTSTNRSVLGVIASSNTPFDLVTQPSGSLSPVVSGGAGNRVA